MSGIKATHVVMAAVACMVLGYLLAGLFRPGVDAVEQEAARLRGDMLAERARDAGWAVAMAENTQHLTRSLQRAREGRDSAETAHNASLASLARELEAAQAELEAVIEFQAVAAAQLQASAEAHGDPAQPDSFTARYDDGLLSGTAVLTPRPSPILSLDYRVDVPGTLVVARTPDLERLMVLARSSDPRVELDIPMVDYELPPPIQRCGWGTKSRYGVGGIATGVLLTLFSGG